MCGKFGRLLTRKKKVDDDIHDDDGDVLDGDAFAIRIILSELISDYMIFTLHNSLTEVYFSGFSWGSKRDPENTQSVKRPGRSAGPESQKQFAEVYFLGFSWGSKRGPVNHKA